MNPSSEERAALRKLLQARLSGKATGFQDEDLNVMLKQGLSTEGRLAIASWSELAPVLPRVLVHILLAAYNSSALNGPGVCSTCSANFALAVSFTDHSWRCFITHASTVLWLICRRTQEACACVQAQFMFVW